MSLLIDNRDQHFVLFEQLNILELTKLNGMAEFDQGTVESILELADTIGTEQFYSVNMEGDSVGTTYNKDNSTAKVPEGYHAAFAAFAESGLTTLTFTEEQGGAALPDLLWRAATEHLKAGSVPLTQFGTLTKGLASLIARNASEELKQQYFEKLVTLQWGGTMCLTEPGAGSDVGALTTAAIPQEDGRYKIKGQKIFITCGEHNLTENIVHAVLARVEGAPAGTKGISIFLVPKFIQDGDNLIPNDVNCSGIEAKMGIKGSPTASLNFGDQDNCYGWIIGKEGQGMKIMFEMMNDARLGVGVEALAISSSAYLHAKKYAAERMQGKALVDGKPQPATIDQHPDVQRMLLSMKSKVEAMRGLTYFCATQLDYIELGTPEEKELSDGLMALLIPVVKAGNSDSSWEITADAIQTHGGYGFCKEYRVEQLARDCKILSLYEGTNGIQSIDLLMRKILKDPEMKAVKHFGETIKKCLESGKDSLLPRHIEAMSKTMLQFEKAIGALASKAAGGDLNAVLFDAVPFQRAFKVLSYSWIHCWAIQVAKEKAATLGASHPDIDFYSSRVESGEYYLNYELPQCRALLLSITQS